MPLAPGDALALLQRALNQDRLGHAYLITGDEGSGKQALAAALCRLLTDARAGAPADIFTHPDVHCIRPESKSRKIVVEQIREMERELQMRSMNGSRKAGVIFDADRLMTNAANAFLKTLEEPPGHSYLLLLTHLPEQLLETIRSRCIRIALQAPPVVVLTPRERELLESLRDARLQRQLNLPECLGLVRQFQRLLGEARSVAQAAGDEEFDTEQRRYKGIADARYLKEREEQIGALTESRYLAERVRLLEILERWWADALRQRTACDAGGSTTLDFPEFAAATADLGEKTVEELLLGAEAFETLREQMGSSGIQEALAIEVAFLKALGNGSGRALRAA